MEEIKAAWRLIDGDVVSIDIGNKRKAILRLLFRWGRGTDVFWVYPPEALSAAVVNLTAIRPLAFLGVIRNTVNHPMYRRRIQRLGHCPLTIQEKDMPIFESGGNIYKRNQLAIPIDWSRPKLSMEFDINQERYPDIQIAAFDGLVLQILELLGFDQNLISYQMERLLSPNEKERHDGTYSISRLGRIAGRPALGRLITLLKNDKSPMVRRGAAMALGHLGFDRDDVQKALEAGLKDKSAQVRHAAKDAIQAMKDGYYKLNVDS